MAQKEAGGRSSSQNDFLEPSAPENVTATDVGSGRAFNDGAITVTWTVNALSPAPTSYTIEKADGTDLNTGSMPTPSGGVYTVVVGGLTSAASYTPQVFLTNDSGSSAATAASAVTVTTVPATPAAPTATAAVNEDNVSWTAPATGGSAISTYTYESDESPVKEGTLAGTSVTVTNEANTAQAYRVKATNANGDSVFSAIFSGPDTWEEDE